MREPSDLDRGAGRQGNAKIIVPNVDMTEKFVDIGDEGRRLHQVVQRGARRFQGGAQVLADLPNLRPHVTRSHDISGFVARELARNENKFLRFGDDYMRVKDASFERTLKQGLGLNFGHRHGWYSRSWLLRWSFPFSKMRICLAKEGRP